MDLKDHKHVSRIDGNRLELVRDLPENNAAQQLPHCDEHFLYTVHCAACNEIAAANAKPSDNPLKAATKQAKAPSQRSSRSFGFTDNLPHSLVHEPSLFDEMSGAAGHTYDDFDVVTLVIDALIDPLKGS